MRGKTAGKPPRPNLNDVARSAQVSASTVSLVLAGKAKERYISDEVIARVHQAAASLDYSPNMLVRSMQRGRTNILCFYNGFRYHQTAHDLYTVGLFSSAAGAAGSHGYNLLLFCDYSQTPDETYHTLNGGHADGMIFFAPQQDDPLLPYLRNSRLPVVLLNSEDSTGALSSVKDDTSSGMRQVTDRLVALGHQRVAVLSPGTLWNVDAEHRIDLLKEYLAEHGISIPESSIIPVPFDPAQIEQAIQQIMSGPQTPTALFCWNDSVGYMALDACARLDISVPDQLSVLGYDGIPWPARTSHTLASVHVDLTRIAEEATDVLHSLIRGEIEPPVRRIVPVQLQDGTTLAPPMK